MKIGFDIDFTIARHEQFISVVNELFKDKGGFTIDDYTVYPLERSLEKLGYIEDVEAFNQDNAFYVMHAEQLYPLERFYQEFIQLYNWLVEEGHEVYFITARNKSFEHLTKQQFELNGIPYQNVFHLGSYHKEGLINELGIELFFEDNVGNIGYILEATKCTCVKVVTPYNRDAILPEDRVILLRDWSEVRDMMECFLKDVR